MIREQNPGHRYNISILFVDDNETIRQLYRRILEKHVDHLYIAENGSHGLELYQKHKPDLVFCSNQRNTKNISSLLAAKDLGIKTMCFIQSWDNVPKAMQVVETDFYLVWSELMQKELLKYYSGY